MRRYGVTEEDIAREAEQDDRNYQAVKRGCLYGDIGCLLVPVMGFLLLVPSWVMTG